MPRRLIRTAADLPSKPTREGKVWAVYRLDDGRLVMVATDRMSVFDVVMREAVPGKGHVLAGISAWWFRQFASVCPSHFITDDLQQFPIEFRLFPEVYEGRSMLVQELQMIPVECVVRGYLAGSGLKDYLQTGRICDISLPMGLQEGSKLPGPIFTPSTKVEVHDRNISFEEMVGIVGSFQTAVELQNKSLQLYRVAAAVARARGLILADTKLEFGYLNGAIVWGDEAFTTDSSRLWLVSEYQPGQPPPSLDKQPVRNWAEATGWNKQPPPPTMPAEIVAQTTERYRQGYRMLTGHDLPN